MNWNRELRCLDDGATPKTVPSRKRTERVSLAVRLAAAVRSSLRPAARRYGWTRMSGMCGAAMLALRAALAENGVECLAVLELRFSLTRAAHAWVEVDGWVIDPTATQFWTGAPRVLVVPTTSEPYASKRKRLYGEKAMEDVWRWGVCQDALAPSGQVKAGNKGSEQRKSGARVRGRS